MDSRAIWKNLRGDSASQEAALKVAEQTYGNQESPSAMMELGVTYLWLGKYHAAAEHFENELRYDSVDVFFGMGGVARWCLGEPAEAVSLWRDGLKAKYARASGLNIRIPMLLFFASVVRPETFKRDGADKLLRKKVANRRIGSWPGAVVRRLVGQIDEDELRKEAASTSFLRPTMGCWLADFYEALLQHDVNGQAATSKVMSGLADTLQPVWQEVDAFLTLVWNEEFFLARHEGKGE